MFNKQTTSGLGYRLNEDRKVDSVLTQEEKGANLYLLLPTYNPRVLETCQTTANFSLHLQLSLIKEIKILSQKTGSNVFVILLSTFHILLHRYTQQNDIPAGYYHQDINGDIIGLGKNLSGQPNQPVFRIKFESAYCLLELVKYLHKSIVEADAQQTTSSDIASRSSTEDSNSLFQIMFEFRNVYHTKRKEVVYRNAKGVAIPDIYLVIEETNEGLAASWTYNSGLFKENTIRRMAQHFENLLAGIISNPNECVSHLPLLSPDERNQVIYEWNNTNRAFPENKCIHELFEEQVIINPDQIAVEMYPLQGAGSAPLSNQLTYRDLNCRANQLANLLQDLGVGPDVVVGICIKRSVEMMIGVLAILKAGGAYLPIDPGNPHERIGFLLRDSGISILLTQYQLLPISLTANLTVLCLDSDWNKISKYATKNLVSGVSPLNLAYVIYTSGSTGLPKGTLIIHRGVVNYLTYCQDEYKVTTGSGAPVNSSIAFDATVTSFFSPLLAGKRVLLLPEKNEIERLSSVLLSGNDFSLVKITPAHLEILEHLLSPVLIKNQARALVIGGEALRSRSLEFWHKHAPSTRLINEYGPTETVVGCCTYEIQHNQRMPENVPIGKPIANTRLYILDNNKEPVPVGVTGEIYIGGAGVARGYLNRPELTEQRFVPNPFTHDAYARLYKTGDLGSYSDDGNVTYMGRVDDQVKIRGYRIEPVEIESAIIKYPSVEHVAVLAQENNNGDKRLVAYLVAKGQSIPVNDLRLFLSKLLPQYMVPAAFIFLNSLPLTINGKIDRQALINTNFTGTRPSESYVAPRDKMEQQLVSIFEKILHNNHIGVQNDFFELGGSSIQAAIIISQVRKIFGKKLALSFILHSPTIEKLAALIRDEKQEIYTSSLVSIQPKGSKPVLFCVHGGWGNVLFYRRLSKYLGNDQPVYALQAKGLNGKEDPLYTLEEMAAHYIREIRRIQPKGPYHIAGYCFGAIAAFEMGCQLVSMGEKVAFLGSFNGVSPGYYLKKRDQKIVRGTSLKNRLLNSLRLFKQTMKRKMVVGQFYCWVGLRAICYKFYFARGRDLPVSLQRFYVVDAILTAQEKYVPGTYDGDLIIFRSPQIYKQAQLGWEANVCGRIKTIDIAGNHLNRTRIMYEPFVQDLAMELKNHLAAINAGAQSKITSGYILN